jgi:plasmid stability protein
LWIDYGCSVKTTCLTIRKCPAPVHAALKARARVKGRSLNAEALEVLASALPERLSEEELIRRVKSAGVKTSLTVEETREAIRMGRL